MLGATKDSQEHQLRTNKQIADLAGAESDEEAHEKFGSLITIIRSENTKNQMRKSQK